MSAARWLVPAVSAQGVYAGAVVTDKVVLEHRRPSPLSLAVATSVVNCVIGVALLAMVGAPTVSANDVSVMVAAGVCLFVYLLPYFAALSRDDASTVAPLFQLVAVFTVALGWVALGISLHGYQWIGCLAVTSGAAVFMVGDGQMPWKVRRTTAELMALSSAILAVALVCLNQALDSAPYWQTMSIVALSIGFSGLVGACVLRVRHPGQPLMELGKIGWTAVVVAELLGTAGNGLQADAIRAGSAPLVSVVVGTQPIILMGLGLMVSTWMPQVLTERVSRRNIISKVVGAIAVLAGLSALVLVKAS